MHSAGGAEDAKTTVGITAVRSQQLKNEALMKQTVWSEGVARGEPHRVVSVKLPRLRSALRAPPHEAGGVPSGPHWRSGAPYMYIIYRALLYT